MKKIILKKQEPKELNTAKNYKINYQFELNQAQYEAVMHNDGPALVIAGAGTGKTRTLVYRVSRLIEDNIQPESILLLTFTRRASKEMLRRASMLLDGRCERVSGGTFHSFATNILRRYAELIDYQRNFTIIDQGDSEDAINFVRNRLKMRSRKRDSLQRVLYKEFIVYQKTPLLLMRVILSNIFLGFLII